MPDGTIIQRLTLRGGGLVARVLTLGAVVQDLRLEGYAHPLVLGSETPDAYLGPMAFFGAMVGRFANRIAGGRFVLDGCNHQIPRNFRGRHALHGGPAGSALRLWQVLEQHTESATLGLQMADGDMGFPGALEVRLGESHVAWASYQSGLAR